MSIGRERDTESTSHEYLLGDGADPLLPSHHMRYLHELVIDHDRSVIGRESIRLHEDLILDFIGVEFYLPSDDICENDGLIFGYLESDCILFSRLDSLKRLLEWEMATVSIISRWELELLLLSTKLSQSLRATEAVVRTPLFAELMQSRSIEIESLTLDIRTIFSPMTDTLIRSQSEDLMCIQDRIDGPLDETSSIGILYTDDILSLSMSSPQVAIQSCTE
jgi:hypothetical protein